MLKVKINRNIMTNGMDIYLYEERADGKFAIGLPTKLEFEVVDDEELGNIQEPTIKLSGHWGKQFLEAFAEALDGEGVKTNKDERIAGTLDATKYHLEDLRQLLKLEARKSV